MEKSSMQPGAFNGTDLNQGYKWVRYEALSCLTPVMNVKQCEYYLGAQSLAQKTKNVMHLSRSYFSDKINVLVPGARVGIFPLALAEEGLAQEVNIHACEVDKQMYAVGNALWGKDVQGLEHIYDNETNQQIQTYITQFTCLTHEHKLTFDRKDITELGGPYHIIFAPQFLHRTPEEEYLHAVFEVCSSLLGKGGILAADTASHFERDPVFTAEEYAFRFDPIFKHVVDTLHYAGINFTNTIDMFTPLHDAGYLASIGQQHGFKSFYVGAHLSPKDKVQDRETIPALIQSLKPNKKGLDKMITEAIDEAKECSVLMQDRGQYLHDICPQYVFIKV